MDQDARTLTHYRTARQGNLRMGTSYMYGSFNGYKLGAFGLLVTIETALTHKSEGVEPLVILFSKTGSNG
ncbi:unnamed protein product [Sphenostylis stenocarpa]|uniref:Uncharacterized protein n=1 Tax=Sphenostylis stenocarpa TaxID=92480 RepID=A0AA86S4W7_9FABA|nr:unnamed protein product [Sphenostylis stenocarpa]